MKLYIVLYIAACILLFVALTAFILRQTDVWQRVGMWGLASFVFGYSATPREPYREVSRLSSHPPGNAVTHREKSA